ncbi:DUF4185 domain-containing protein [Parachryseolinea silvisoli]|uniref:DUF4185 domain-containing protein n=1 Tax=Parachryseolinea silvisoli TaxID=2873601 RepID=UPI00226598DD|nr:DUF4185 domain-containing protein [Parachryseolinea silvisoli]MCD9017658.1 DUF4185 domain-containing protein [Parachryseolinea silvisoli]
MMKQIAFYRVLIALAVAGVGTSCQQKKEEQKETTYSVHAAPEWTALFTRSQGWFGADGIFSIPLKGNDGLASDDTVLFVFSDTMFGEAGDPSQSGAPGLAMINNSVMLLTGNEPREGNAKFIVGKDTTSVFLPSTPKAQPGDYYWLGDGVVDHEAGDSLYIFGYLIQNTNDGSKFPFRQVGTTLLICPPHTTDFSKSKQIDLPLVSPSDDPAATAFGAGIYANTEAAGSPDPDGYLYIYGVRGPGKDLVAARTKAGTLARFSSWEFRTSDGWTKDLKEAARLADSVSNEMSVSAIGNGQYALIYQLGGIFSQICMQIGSSPAGPFERRKVIWDTSSELTEKDIYTYNAKAHPALSKPGELLISYNINSFNFLEQLKKTPNFYHPRFIKVVFDKK